MSKVKKYQDGQAIAQPVIYKIKLDGQTYEFTDDEIDRVWGQIQPTIIEKGFKGDRLNEQYAIFKEQARTGEYSLDTSPVGTLSGTYSGNATNLGTDQRIGGFRKALGLTSKEGLMNVINHHLGSGLKDFVGKRDIQAKEKEAEQARLAKIEEEKTSAAAVDQFDEIYNKQLDESNQAFRALTQDLSLQSFSEPSLVGQPFEAWKDYLSNFDEDSRKTTWSKRGNEIKTLQETLRNNTRVGEAIKTSDPALYAQFQQAQDWFTNNSTSDYAGFKNYSDIVNTFEKDKHFWGTSTVPTGDKTDDVVGEGDLGDETDDRNAGPPPQDLDEDLNVPFTFRFNNTNPSNTQDNNIMRLFEEPTYIVENGEDFQMITQKEGKNYLYSTSNNFEGREISDEELKALMPFQQDTFNKYMNDIPTLIQKLDNFDARIKRYQKGAAITIDYGGRSSTLGETVDNVDNLSTVDWLDLATLGLDIMAIFPTGPVAAGSGIAGGITGLTADIKRDGLNWQNGLTGQQSILAGAAAFIPGGGTAKIPVIMAKLGRMKKTMVTLQTVFTGLGLAGGQQIAKKIYDEGVENLTVEDLRMLGGALAGLRNVKNAQNQQSALKKVDLGESRLTNVKVKVDGRTVKRSIVLSEDEVKSLANPPEGKRSQDILKEVAVRKLQSDPEFKGSKTGLTTDQIITDNFSLKRAAHINPIKSVKGLFDRTPVITTKQQSGLSVKDLPDEPSSLPQPLKQLKGWLYGSRVDGYNTIRTQPDLIPNKNLTKPILGVKDNKVQIKQGNEMLPGQTMRDIHGQQSNAKIELKEAVKQGSDANATKKKLPALEFSKKVVPDIQDAQKRIDVEVKKGEQLLTKLQEITAKQNDPEVVKAFTKTTNSLQEQLEKAKSTSSSIKNRPFELNPYTYTRSNKINVQPYNVIPAWDDVLRQVSPRSSFKFPIPKIKPGTQLTMFQGGGFFDFELKKGFNQMYNRTQPFELPFVPYKNFNFDKSTTPFTLKKGFDLPITSKGFVKSVKTPTVIDQLNPTKALETPTVTSGGSKVHSDSGDTKFKFPPVTFNPAWATKFLETQLKISGAKRQDTRVSPLIQSHMTEFLPTVDLSEGIIRDGIHKAGTNLSHSLNKNYTSDATRNTIQRESVQNTIGDMTTQGNQQIVQNRTQNQNQINAATNQFNMLRSQTANQNQANIVEADRQQRANKNQQKAAINDLQTGFIGDYGNYQFSKSKEVQGINDALMLEDYKYDIITNTKLQDLQKQNQELLSRRTPMGGFATPADKELYEQNMQQMELLQMEAKKKYLNKQKAGIS